MSKTLVVAFGLLTGGISAAQELDYRVVPVAPNLVRTAETTYLVDFTRHKAQADFAAGDATIGGTPQWVEKGGVRGPLEIALPGNLDPAVWTIELVLRPLGGGLNQSSNIGGWDSPDNVNYYRTTLYPGGFMLGAGAMPKVRRHAFNLTANATGNGFSVPRDGAGKTVYLAMGFDARRHLAGSVARTLDGEVLAGNMSLVSPGIVSREFLEREGIAPAQAEAAIGEAWDDIAATFKALATPAKLRLGHEGLEIVQLRISKKFDAGVALATPSSAPAMAPSRPMRLFTGVDLAPAKFETRRITRNLGLPGYHNYRPYDLDEKYVALAPGQRLDLKLPGLAPSLYSLYIYGTVARQGRDKLPRVWQPAPLDFEVRDAAGKVQARGRMLLKQGFAPRRMQGFHFHAPAAGDYTATFRLSDKAQETPEFLAIALVDQMDSLPDIAIKKAQNLEPGAAAQLTTLTPERQTRDALIWNALPPLNVEMQVHAQVKQFLKPPVPIAAGEWEIASIAGLPAHKQPAQTFTPLDFKDAKTGEFFSSDRVLVGEPLPGAVPDDGTGVFFTKKDYPELPHDIYYAPRAELLGSRYLLFMGAIVDSKGSFRGLDLGTQYHDKGDPNIGHDAALALVRFAYDWPALEMNLHELRLSTHSPDLEYNTDWSASRNGKMFYEGWSGSNLVGLLTTYDQIFPYIKDNQVFADAVHRFIPWVKTPTDVVRLLDRYLVFAGDRDFNSGRIRAAPVEDVAAQVLGFSPQTARWFDLTQARLEMYPMEGTYQEIYGTGLTRAGAHYIGSYMVYAMGVAQQTIKKAAIVADTKRRGYKPIMDLSDVARYPKVRAAGDFAIDMFTAGGYPIMVGDASGGPHSPRESENRLRATPETSQAAFDLWQDKRHAWLLANLHRKTDPAIAAAAAGVKNPLLHQYSRVIPNEMAVVETGSDETDPLKKGSTVLRLGIGQGHSHNDYLDLNIFGMGLPLAVDLACRNEGSFWSRPGAAWSFLHNHALPSNDENPSGAGGQSGEPWLRAFAPPLLRASYIDSTGKERLDRDLLTVPLGDSGDHYIFDVQRLKGGALHTWSFHGAESHDLQLNVPTEPAETRRWIDRTLEGARRAGKASEVLQATWTMSRTARDVPHTFNGGGVIKTVAAEQASLQKLFDETRPPARLRATLLGQAGADVLQGNPYSQQYAYSFPFLWVQAPAKPESVYPAIYEYYRGDTPALSKIELVKSDPLTVRVTTAAGQVDTFTQQGNALTAVSRDAKGLRWAKLSQASTFTDGAFSIVAARPAYSTTVTAIDYVKRTLTTAAPLPANAGVTIGNDGRRSFLQLTGAGTSFTLADDLLMHEGKLTDFAVKDGLATIKSEPALLFEGRGNRKAEGFTVTNEDATWQFRGGKVIRQPEGAALDQTAFTDANNDGFINVKSYEAGVGDGITLPGDVEVRRTAAGTYEIMTNVEVTLTLAGKTVKFPAAAGWQVVK